jgi:branched-chain amino acid transport system substrate-binding protein
MMIELRQCGCALAVFVCTLLFGTLAPAQTEPVKIGLTGPFTGGSAPMGESMRNGVRLRIAEYNKYGGLLGRPIELVERDDQANPERGAAIAKELVEKEKVVATIGIVNTGVGLASIDHYQRAQVPLLIAVSTGSALTRKYAPPAAPENYIFRVSPRIDVETAFLAEELAKRNLRRVAILADSTPYSEAGLNDLRSAIGSKSLDLVTVERYDIGNHDMRAQLKRAQASGAQVLVTYGIGPELAAIAKNRGEMRWKVPFYGSWTLSMQNFIEVAGKDGIGALMPQTFIQEASNIRRNTFMVDYKNNFRTEHIASPMSAAQGYDAALLLIAAINQARGADGKRIKDALENLQKRVYGVVTTYDHPFKPDDHGAITFNMLVLGRVQDGRVVYAYEHDERRGLLERRKQK